jgi:hypothetical protein
MLRGYTERYVRAMLDGPDQLKGKLIRAKGVKTNETAVLLTGRA